MIMTITFNVSEKTKKKMLEYYKDLKKEVKVDYYLFQAKENNVTITLYKSKTRSCTYLRCF